jgi:uncharacterized membrane-anchored protein
MTVRQTKGNIMNTPLNRVPQIIAIYWVIKIASTTLGETGADMFSMTFNIGYSVTILIFMSLFLFLLGIKLSIKKYEPILYWLVFTATAIVGTAISDFIDRTLGLGYTLGASALFVLLIIVLAFWKKVENTISVEEIRTRNAEIFYWLAFLVANTLGTAAGDFLADELGIGFLRSAMIISIVLVGIVLLHFYTKISGIILFWFAFVLTRPFGATFGDLLTKSSDQGGLNFGTICSSIFFLVVLILAVMKESKYENLRRVDNDA